MSAENKEEKEKKFFLAYFFDWIGFSEKTVAGFFNFVHTSVDLADMPIRRTVMVLQPVIAPIVPAAFIRASLLNHMQLSSLVSNVAAIALVMVGFSGGIAYTKASVRLEKNPKNVVLIADKNRAKLAWGIYLFSIVVITVALEWAYSTDSVFITMIRVIVILSLTFGLEVSTSILNAKRIVEEAERESKINAELTAHQRTMEEKKLRANTSLKRTALKQGMSVAGIAYAADMQNITGAINGASSAKDAPLSDKDKRQIRRFREELAVVGNWRIDGKKMTQSDLRWLSTAKTSVIKLAIGGENTPAKTAQNWRNNAKRMLGKK